MQTFLVPKMGLRRQRFEKMEPIWNVLYTASRQEKKVAQRFVDKGIEYYLPVVKVISQWSDRKKTIEKPLFNSYIFVKEIPHYEAILQTNGVVGFLKFNKLNAKVYQHEIDTIKSMIAYGYDIAVMVYANQIEIGQKVQVNDGPLKGHIGELFSKPDGDWFVVHFENLGNSLKIKMPAKILKPIA